jgi:surfactin synthase thioesterase subunit
VTHRAASSSTAETWLRRFDRPGGAADPDAPLLICLPHAGGAATYYRPLAEMLNPEVDVLAVQYPGRQDRRLEPHPGTIEGLADGVLAALRSFAGRRISLFGHSMGAVVGFEVALRSDAAGLPVPSRLFASGRRAPVCYRPMRPVHLWSNEAVFQELRSLGGTDLRALEDPEVAELVMPAIRSDYRAIETYKPKPDASLSCPVTALVGSSDSQCTVAEAIGWKHHAGAGFALEVLPGGHFYLNQMWPLLADVIRRQILGIDGRRSAAVAPR